MPTVTLTLETLTTLGVRSADLMRDVLPPETVKLLEPLLIARGFDVTRSVNVVVPATDEGVTLTQ